MSALSQPKTTVTAVAPTAASITTGTVKGVRYGGVVGKVIPTTGQLWPRGN